MSINGLSSTSNCSGLQQSSNIILQTLKRRNNKPQVPLDERVSLEKTIGFSITSNVKLTQLNDAIIAYLAGCVIVLYDTKKCKQDFIVSQARKTLTTLSVSSDSRILATGESGHDPRVRVWDVKDKIQIGEFGGHKFSIECVYFSPNSNLLISIGSIHDSMVNVWNWVKKYKVASNKLSCKIKGVSFSRDGNYFVTVGNRHVKFWYLTLSTLMETVPLKGRAAILNDMKNNDFCAVVCGRGECSHYTYALTTNGILCGFDENRSLSKVIELRSEYAYCLQADDDNLYIGCSQGTILIFNQYTLSFVSGLPRPHSLGVDISKGLDTRHLIENLSNSELKYPDCIAIAYNQHDAYLTAIYNDHSLYVWDIKDVSKVKKIDSHLFHSSSCYALDMYSNVSSYLLPQDSFITSSSDNTLRIWSLANTNGNIYSKELIHMIYVDNDLSALCDNVTRSSTQESSSDYMPNSGENLMLNPQQVTLNLAQNALKFGSRCMKISPTGRHLATGDRSGNIRIYDLKLLESMGLIEAHESEILYLQYSQPESGRLLLASASRDRLIHIFDAKKNYELIQTLDDHSAAITATRFCYNHIEKQFYVISCGYDKSIIFRSAHETCTNSSSSCNSSNSSNFGLNHELSDETSCEQNKLQFQRTHLIAEKQTFFDMIVDPTRNYINTVSADRIIRTYSIKDGKKLRQFKGSLSEDGYLLKMDMNIGGTLLATSCSDKCVYVWDTNTCECLAQLYGHSELIVDLKFTHDNQYLITISADSCIFVWKLNNITNFISSTSSSCAEKSINRRSTVLSSSVMSVLTTTTRDILNSTEASTCHNDDELPQWAQKTLASRQILTTQSELPTGDNILRRSRPVWGSVCNTSFAIQVDNDLDESLSSSSCKSSELLAATSKAVIQFPSPNVEKSLYQVVTLDSTMNKSLLTSKLSSEDSKDEEDTIPTTPTKENPFFTHFPHSGDDIHFGDAEQMLFSVVSDSGGQQRRQSISARYLQKTSNQNSLEPNSPRLPISEVLSSGESNSSSRSSSNTLSPPPTTSQLPPPLLPASQPPTVKPYPTNMNAQLAAELLKIRKNKLTSMTNNSQPTLHSHHTESSLNKIKARQSLVIPHAQNQSNLSVEKLSKSPSMVSINACDSCVQSSDDTQNHLTTDNFVSKSLLNKSNSAKNSPTKQLNHIPSGLQTQQAAASLCAHNLKKAASMMSLNQNPQCSLSSSSSFNSRQQVAATAATTTISTKTTSNGSSSSQGGLPPKTVRQVKSKAQEKQNMITACSHSNKTTATSTDTARLRKLSNSIQNLQENSPTKHAPESIVNRHVTIKTTRKKRANTEELMMPINVGNEENSLKPPQVPTIMQSPSKKSSNIYESSQSSLPNKYQSPSSKSTNGAYGFTTFNEHYYKVLSAFKTNIYALESIYSQTKLEDLTECEQKQKIQLLEKFNTNTTQFINQIDLLSATKPTYT